VILRLIYDEKLAQSCYLIGCAESGEALVVDPSRDLGPLLGAVEAEGLRVAHVTETHIHADFVSGSRELARRTGAQLHLSDEGGEAWRYRWAGEAGARLLLDGDAIEVGAIRAEAMHTPGHTPEHLSFLVTDRAAADHPMGVCTGDFLFVGDVGRPDLLERAAAHAGTMEEGARTLFRSLQSFRRLEDWLQIWPGHGAGSACGKSLGGVPQSTLGFEKRFNWAFQIGDQEEFVAAVLAGQPEPPMYFAEMKRVNRDGPALLGELSAPPPLPPEELPSFRDSGGVVLDARSGPVYAASHLRGSLAAPLGRSFPTYAGSVVPAGSALVVVVGEQRAREAAVELAKIGLERVEGRCDPAALEGWLAGAGKGEAASTRSVALETGEALVVDVRNPSEREEGLIEGSVNLPLGRLREHLAELPRDRDLVVHCESSGRARVALSLLEAEGFSRASHLEGDLAAWRRAGRPLVRPASGTPA
jgi:hydroxyacylglutathione hydrolase